mmetsp:Transcript_40036/g.72132  ORF Transcript_40036/g.72132 Transcript_40036/m.72132 type:complete len:91 (+) Transcript_40036:158-430(+)
MMKKGTFAPPALNSLSSMQRSFLRNSQRMITDTIINTQEVYDEATNESNKKDTAASDTTCTSPEKNNSQYHQSGYEFCNAYTTTHRKSAY